VRLIALSISLWLAIAAVAIGADKFTVVDAIRHAINTHPDVGQAAAHRRATEAVLRQGQGTLLPQVRLDARAGPERLSQQITPPPLGNDTWLRGRDAGVTVRQTLFDGFASINDIWRRAADVDAAAYRVHERTELVALDAAESYIDVVRYIDLIAIAQENIAVHRKILLDVRSRFIGGRSGMGDLEQAEERVAAAEATLADLRRNADDARAAYRRNVGLEPFNLRKPGRLHGLPGAKEEALAVAVQRNPTIQAAKSDAESARYGFHATAGDFVPNISVEAHALRGKDSDNFLGTRDQASAKLVASWDIFNGGQSSWRRAEAADRMIEADMRHASLQRAALESIDKAWSARTLTADRIAALTREVESDRKIVVAFGAEYELGQRTLIDVLNAQNQLFGSLVSLTTTRSVAVFADYQLLAAMGTLMDYLGQPHAAEEEPFVTKPFGPFPLKMAPLLLTAPVSASQPPAVAPPMGAQSPAADKGEDGTFADRWPQTPARPNIATGSGWRWRSQ